MRSSKVTIGLLATLAAAVVACGGDEMVEVNADNQRICITRHEQRRASEHNCPDNGQEDQDLGGAYHPIWIYGGHPAPAIGQTLQPGTPFHTLKPSTGTFAVPPASGGFGTAKVPAGG